MTLLRPLAAALLLIAVPLPALAGTNGKWDCHSFGADVSIGISGTNYILANRHGPSGPGTIKADPYDDSAFVVTNGPLNEGLGVYMGKVADNGDLSLTDSNGAQLVCPAR